MNLLLNSHCLSEEKQEYDATGLFNCVYPIGNETWLLERISILFSRYNLTIINIIKYLLQGNCLYHSLLPSVDQIPLLSKLFIFFYLCNHKHSMTADD